MKNIVLFDPSIRSLNMGDHIIMNSAEKVISNITKNQFIIKAATHAPIVTFYQNTSHNPRIKLYDDAKYKFICGSNLLWRNLCVPRPTFNVNHFNSRPYNGSVLLGVGTHHKNKKLNLYTRTLYNKILSKDFIHSVRDNETKELVESMGFKAINTGCPTMWGFTEEFCSVIPTKKADNVIFTLTDYSRNIEQDQKMIDILVKSYSKVYYWVQGIYDLEYLKEFDNTEKIIIVSPPLEEFSKILSTDDIEYVGTRLHAGMFAMQHKKRAVIISIDNRVESMKATYGLNSVYRNNIEDVEDMINSEFETKININEKNINDWLSQFETQ